jgi:adenine-specific DNA-methyltransferase
MKWNIDPELRRRMTVVARELRRRSTPGEEILRAALRNRQLDGRKFRRQQPVGPFVLDFYCSDERLAIEVDGGVHLSHRYLDEERQTLIESLGIRFVRVDDAAVRTRLPFVLDRISDYWRQPAVGAPPLRSSERGSGGEA